jgi:2-methylfumaryl-CoA isomerase
MIVAISNRQWRAIGKATGITEKLAMIGPMMDVDLDTEGGRFEARAAIFALLDAWCAKHTLAEATAILKARRALGPLPGFRPARAEDPRCSHGATRCSARSTSPAPAASWRRLCRSASRAASGCRRRRAVMGQDTDAVLAEVLGMSSAQIGKLHDSGTIAGPA